MDKHAQNKFNMPIGHLARVMTSVERDALSQ